MVYPGERVCRLRCPHYHDSCERLIARVRELNDELRVEREADGLPGDWPVTVVIDCPGVAPPGSRPLRIAGNELTEENPEQPAGVGEDGNAPEPATRSETTATSFSSSPC